METDPLLYEPPAQVGTFIPGMTNLEWALSMFGTQSGGMAIVVLRHGVLFGVVEGAAVGALVAFFVSFFGRNIKALRNRE